MKNKFELLVRRAAAKLVSDYPPPPLAATSDLLSELTAVGQLAPEGSEWASFAAEIRSALLLNGADAFLRLPPIAKTLHSRQRSHTRRYLDYVVRSKRASATIQKALTESPVGQPLVNPHYPLSSPLLVQHGYHLIKLLESTDFDPAALKSVVEFGGGYGSFFRLLRNLGYRDPYLICDLPVMCALQRFYLRNLFPADPGQQPPTNLQWQSNGSYSDLRERATLAPSLFIATWSLSETPLPVRTAVEPFLSAFTYILIAYQRAFGTYDNVAYFSSLQNQLSQFDWQHTECSVYRNNFYLIGRRTSRS